MGPACGARGAPGSTSQGNPFTEAALGRYSSVANRQLEHFKGVALSGRSTPAPYFNSHSTSVQGKA